MLVKDATFAVATYSLEGETFTVSGHPGDLYTQLELFCSLYPNTFRLISVQGGAK